MKKKRITRKKTARKRTPKTAVLWITASGAAIKPADMGDDHLTNTVAMLRRRHHHDLSLLRLLEPCVQTSELKEAVVALKARFSAVGSLHPAYQALDRELCNRGQEDHEMESDAGDFPF